MIWTCLHWHVIGRKQFKSQSSRRWCYGSIFVIKSTPISQQHERELVRFRTRQGLRVSEEYHKYSITTECFGDWHLSTMSSDPVFSHMARPIVVKISCFPQSLNFKCFSEWGVTNGSGMRQRRPPRGVWGTTQTRQRVDQANISPQRERESETCVSFWGKTVVDKHYVRTVVWWKLKCFDQIEQIFVLSSFIFLFYFFLLF